MEKEHIIQTVSDIFAGADAHDWQRVRNAFADNVLLDYTSLSGGQAAVLPAQQIVDRWSHFLPGFDKTHHRVYDFKVEHDNTVATIHFNGHTDHFLGHEKWGVEGTYEAILVKNHSQWLVNKLVFNLARQSGNTDLHAKVRGQTGVK